jgi:UPF0755 protein
MPLSFSAVLVKHLGRIFKELTVVAVMTVGLFFVIALMRVASFFDEPALLSSPKTLYLEKGMSLQTMTTRLAGEGVISSALLFTMGVRTLKRGPALQAGEYLFEGRMSPQDVLDKIRRGDVMVRSLTLPEGLESPVILEILLKNTTLSGVLSLEALPEGSLLPETYHFHRPQNRGAFVARMQKDQKVLLGRLWESRAPGLPFANPQEAVILASLVEKETPLALERPVVAGVFLNRLALKMPLQCDATVRYGLWKENATPLAGALSKDDLKRPSPYNSYLNTGLPPTPICHPGRASLMAVLHPADTKALYFVADGKGGHIFSHTYEAHQKHHQEWRRLRALQEK